MLCFVDADTIVPENAVDRILELHEDEDRCLVLYRLASREPGIRAWLWWTFWGLARRLPLARAKSMPAFMSCDRAHFETLRSLRRVLGDRRGMAADDGGLPVTTASASSTIEASPRAPPAGGWSCSRSDTFEHFLKWVSVVLFRWARTSPIDRFDTSRESMMQGKTMVLALGAVAF